MSVELGSGVGVRIGIEIIPSVSETARRYGLHRKSLQRAIAAGRVEAFIVNDLLSRGDASSLREAVRIINSLIASKAITDILEAADAED